MIKKQILEKEKLLNNIISVYFKENKYKNILNCNFFTVYNNDKFITIYPKNKKF